MMRMDVEGRRRKGRPKRRWIDSVNVDLRENGLSRKETLYMAVQSQPVRNINLKRSLKRCGVRRRMGHQMNVCLLTMELLGSPHRLSTKLLLT